MGREISCEVRVGERSFHAKVELEDEEITVRGPEGFRLRFEELTQLEVSGGVLSLANQKRAVQLVLGKEAVEWAEKARSPRGRLDKLGIRAGLRVVLMGPLPRDLRDEVERSGAVIVRGGLVQLVLFAAEDSHNLGQLDILRELIAANGAIWVIREKGSESLSERAVRAAAKTNKLVAIKVVKLSERHIADKLVIPSSDRPLPIQLGKPRKPRGQPSALTHRRPPAKSRIDRARAHPKPSKSDR